MADRITEDSGVFLSSHDSSHEEPWNEDSDFSDEFFASTADAFNENLKSHPHYAILSIRYDATKKLFIVSHRIDKEFPVSIRKFFEQREIALILLLMEEQLKAV